MRKGSFCMLLFLAALVLGGCGKEGQTPEGTEAVILDVPFIDQRIKYPTGCECVSAVMALQGLGYDISVDDFIDSCMVRGELPEDTETGRVGLIRIRCFWEILIPLRDMAAMRGLSKKD